MLIWFYYFWKKNEDMLYLMRYDELLLLPAVFFLFLLLNLVVTICKKDFYSTAAWVSQYATASSYFCLSKGTPLPPSSLPRAFRSMVIGFIGVSCGSS